MAPSLPLADLSLNCVIRRASPKPVMHRSTQAELRVLGHLGLDEQRRLRPGPMPTAKQLRGGHAGALRAAPWGRARR